MPKRIDYEPIDGSVGRQLSPSRRSLKSFDDFFRVGRVSLTRWRKPNIETNNDGWTVLALEADTLRKETKTEYKTKTDTVTKKETKTETKTVPVTKVETKTVTKTETNTIPVTKVETKTVTKTETKKGPEVVTKMLLDARPNIDTKNKFGLTTLMLAGQDRHGAAVKALLDAGAHDFMSEPTNEYTDRKHPLTRSKQNPKKPESIKPSTRPVYPPRMTAAPHRKLNDRPSMQDVLAWEEPSDKPTMSSAYSFGGIMASGMIRAVAIIASGGSNLIISGYYDTLTTGRWRPIDARNAHAPFALEGFMNDSDGSLDSGSASLILRPLEEILKAFYKHWPDPTSYLHRLIYNPTPIEFLAACCIYWTSISAYYYLHRHHRYQNHFLASGIMLAFMLGWVFDRDWRGALMDFMPLLVYMSLVLSAGVHWVIGIHGRHRAVEVGLVTDEKRGPLLC